MRILRTLFLLAAASFLVPAARTQVTQIPGTGCVPPSYPRAGAAQIGQTFSWGSIVCLGTATHLSVLGVQLPSFLPLQPPITCTSAGTCMLACNPLVVVMGAGGSIAVPNDPRLIGACLCLQGLCYDLNFGCFILSGALQVCIQP